MVGENIQMLRERVQSVRGQAGGLKLGDKLFSSNPGILSGFPMGKRISERVQSVRGRGMLTSKASAPGVYTEKPATTGTQKVVSV